MEIWLWAVIGMMAVCMSALLVKIYLLQKAAEEIANGFAGRLITDTNTLIDISSRDRHMRRLASDINCQLCKLRAQRRRFSQGDLDITLSASGEIIFANTVLGLDEVQVGRLFDRFYTVEAASKSTGLGMAIARMLAEQMGGKVTAEYEGGRLKVCVSLPQNNMLEEVTV